MNSEKNPKKNSRLNQINRLFFHHVLDVTDFVFPFKVARGYRLTRQNEEN